jgi:hypothetical protein
MKTELIPEDKNWEKWGDNITPGRKSYFGDRPRKSGTICLRNSVRNLLRNLCHWGRPEIRPLSVFYHLKYNMTATRTC